MTNTASVKRALVTGAGQRLGQAIAVALGERGYPVGVHYRESAAGAEETASAIRRAGGRAHLLQADLSHPEEARRLAQSAVSALGGLDLLVPSAASFERIPYDELDDEAFARSITLNLAS